MDGIQFDQEVPVYIEVESLSARQTHSNICHLHNDIELICVTKGSFNCQLGNDDFKLKSGDVCFINRKQLHHIYGDDESSSEHKVLVISSSLLTQNQLILENMIRPMLEDQSFSHVKFAGRSSLADQIFSLVNEIEESSQKRECGYQLRMVSLVHEVLRCLYCAYVEEPRKVSSVDSNYLLLQSMLQFIENNYGRDISLEDIAAVVHISKSQCIKIFNRFARQSPIAYLNSFRLEASRDKLRNTNDSIMSISLDCGFASQSYFNRLFLREFGCTPLEYRKAA